MNKKRIITTVLGIPLFGAILTFGNQNIVNLFITVVAILALNEYFSAIKEIANPVKWLGYLSCLSIYFMQKIFSISNNPINVMIIIPIILLILFLQIILTHMKTNIKDIALTLFGILYIVICILFIPYIREMNNGKILIWYLIIATWGTDIFAYIIGKRFGKHKFTNISPNKSLEGSIAGVLGAFFISAIYTIVLIKCGFNYSFINITIITVILSIISQVGDLAASTIKRYVDIKDFGNLIPGHGGVLDRIDSLMLTAPFAYILFQII